MSVQPLYGLQRYYVRHGPKYLEEFQNVRCMVAAQPLSVCATLEQSLALIGIPADRIDDLEERIRLFNSFKLDEMSPVEAAKSVTV